jgi:DNA-binding transcriptional LysR family regulator
VARHGSVTAAAAALRLSQPAVSKQVAELEASLGVRLLERLPRGCRLTEAGRILAEHAQRCQAAQREALEAIDAFRGLKRGRLAIGASQTIGAYLLPRRLAAFRKDWPGVALSLEISNSEAIQQALLARRLDLGLTEGPIASAELHSEPFGFDDIVAVAPAGHPWLRRRGVKAAELCDQPLLLREEGSGTRAMVEQAFKARRLQPSRGLALASPEAIKQAVMAGLGLALVPRLSIELELQAGRLGLLKMADLRIRRPLHLQWLRSRGLSPALERFLGALRAEGSPQGRRRAIMASPAAMGPRGR